jgi:hypothetical protein
MAKAERERDVRCPVCELLECLSGQAARARTSKFAQHLRAARKEVLLAVRSMLDERIEALGKEPAPGPRARRIKVKEAE